jgi:hypothetical protein
MEKNQECYFKRKKMQFDFLFVFDHSGAPPLAQGDG